MEKLRKELAQNEMMLKALNKTAEHAEIERLRLSEYISESKQPNLNNITLKGLSDDLKNLEFATKYMINRIKEENEEIKKELKKWKK